jgi:hypothetical protein
MNRTKIKNYAPKARQEFIQAVTDRAAFYGMKEVEGEVVIEPVVGKGDSVLIGGRAFPRAVGEKRRKLEEQVRQHGFPQTMETLAYTWFNRLVAIRFMELHGYLDHGYRVLSHPEGKPTPEILDHAEHVDLPGLDRQKVIDLKIEGTKEAELYRLLLVAQCNALHDAMPFLFERIDDETELVLPDSLLHSDSLIRNLVSEIDEEDWQEVEIIGWLYESYISERYEAVIGKVVASEDIPAATQRFTPKWIVRYLVQNTLGRLWLATYTHSSLRQQMNYYIEPAEQSPEVQEQLKRITPTSLNPEEITFLDPACGSAHILVEAYDVFKAIYQERGYRARDIPSLILRKNLFGLEIDDRAAQLAAFALLMKARADDRRLFHPENKVQPHVLALQETKGLSANEITEYLNEPVLAQPMPPSDKLFEDESELFSKANMSVAGDLAQADIATLIDLFEDAKTFGSLIQVPPKLAAKLPHIEERMRLVAAHGEGFNRVYAAEFLRFIKQADLLGRRFDCVVANPPYMGGKYFTERLKDFVGDHYKGAKADLYACFIQRNAVFAKSNGFVGMITIPNWMFLSSFEEVRKTLFNDQTIDTFVHNGRGVFGSDFGSCSFVLRNLNLPAYRGVFYRLFDKQGSVASNDELERRFFENERHLASPDDFKKLPGEVIAYWISDKERLAFASSNPLASVALPRQGLATADDDRFLRFWHEVSSDSVEYTAASREAAAKSGKKWFPFNKGGPLRKWYGNNEYLVNWQDDGNEIRHFFGGSRTLRSRPQNLEYYFLPGITWSLISISSPSFRQFNEGFIIGHKGPGIFCEKTTLPVVLAFLNSCVVTNFLSILSPAVGFEIGQIQDLPFRNPGAKAGELAEQLVKIHRQDWDSSETSWDFQRLPLLCGSHTASLEAAFSGWAEQCLSRFDEAQRLEEENNALFINCFDLQEQLSPKVPEDQITLMRPDRQEDLKRLLSYAVGCTMGRYSLDKPGLVYAGSGNVGFDPGQYRTIPADEDGILPVTQQDWGFEDDIARRVEAFVSVALSKEHLAENLKFVADSLGPSKDEQPRDTIRRYFATEFYKDHLRWYKRRPIYWLFSSGKQRAFQCLVYLHRYHEGTLARMRTEYVIPLQGRIAARIEQLEGDKTKATSTSHRRKLQKEQDDLKKQQTELAGFEERLKHAADMRIRLDLDDGVKVNYAKFSELLAEINLKAKVAYVARDFDEPVEDF